MEFEWALTLTFPRDQIVQIPKPFIPSNKASFVGALALILLSAGVRAEETKSLPGSYQTMDYGPVIGETIIAGWPEENVARKGLAIRLDHEATMVFDTDLMRWSVAAAGGWIDLSKTSHTSYKGSKPPSVEGNEIFATAPLPGWAHEGDFADPREGGRGALPRDWALWRGFYRHGNRVVLSYRVGETAVLDSPAAARVEETVVFARSLRVPATEEPLVHYVAQVPAGATTAWRDGSLFVEGEEETVGFRVVSPVEKARLRLGGEGRIEFVLPPHREATEVSLLAWEEREGAGPGAVALTEASRDLAVDFAAATEGGPARWPEKIETAVEIADDSAAYVTDQFALPFENPWGSWMRPSAFDFFADGDRAAVTTWNGDVWIVSGLTSGEDQVSWRRFASGLFFPMGLVVLDEKIHVVERSQLTRLHDLNADGEADFYESVNNAGILHPMAHSLCLQVDSAGNFYFYKNGNRVPETVPEHGALIRVSADGTEREIFATGIRGANGLGIGPDDRLFGVDQQGDWVPTGRVDWLREGGFYGYRPHNPDGRPEGDYDLPICWVPHRVDNSSGDLAYIEDPRWGPMKGNWVMTSYGQSTLLALLVEKDGKPLQGGVVPFPIEFNSGLMRARVNPADGQLYVLGMKGWQTTSKLDGSFERVRFTGLPNRMPVGLDVEPETVRIDFSAPLDPDSVTVENFDVERWQYRYSKRYGSPEMSVENPGERGRDPVAVSGVRLSEDRQSVFVRIPDLKPVMQQSVAYRLRFADGAEAENAIYHTIHRVGDEMKAPVVASAEPVVAQPVAEESGAGDGEGNAWAAFAPGRKIFENTCSVCHQPEGQGIAPALSASAWAGGSPDALIRILLHGKVGQQGTMMPFAWLSDEDISSLLSYIRVRWHGREPIAAEKVQSVREATKEHSGLWTEEALSEFQK